MLILFFNQYIFSLSSLSLYIPPRGREREIEGERERRDKDREGERRELVKKRDRIVK